MRVMIAGPRSQEDIGDFVYGLRNAGGEVTLSPSGKEALESLESFKPDLVVVDEKLPDFGAFQFIIEVLKKNVMIQTAVITSLPEDEFHVQSEGLGILKAIGPQPNEQDAIELLKTFKQTLDG